MSSFEAHGRISASRAAFNSSSGCSGPFWDGPSLERCHLQRYFEFYPLAITLSVFGLYTVLSVGPALIRALIVRFSGKKSTTDYRPLLSDDAEVASLSIQQSTVSRTLTTVDNDDPDSPIEQPKERSDPASYILVRGKSISDRFRLICELILSLGQVLFSILGWVTPAISDGYLRYSPNTTLLYVAFTGYVFLLVLYRTIFMNSTQPLKGSPFSQTAYLYTVSLIVAAINAYDTSARHEPVNESSLAWIIYAMFVTDALRWLIIITSPMGDSRARIYMKPGLKPSLEPTSSLLRTCLCCWNVEMILGVKNSRMEFEDVWELRESAHSYKIFEAYSKTNPNRHYVLRIIQAFSLTVFLVIFHGVLGAIMSLVPSMFINLILRYIESPNGLTQSVAWLMVFGLALSLLLQYVFENQAYYHGRRLSVFVRAVIIGEIYKKALYREVSTQDDGSKKKADADSEEDGEDADTKYVAGNIGSILNLMSVDSFKLAEFAAYTHYLVASPVAVIVAVYYLFQILSWSAFAGVAVMLLSLPINYAFARRLASIDKRMMAVTDKRVDKTNELLSAIRIIKFFAWESRFANQIYTLRDKELQLLRARYTWWTFSAFIFYVLPLGFTAVSFICYIVLEGKELTSSVAFTALAVFNVLRYPIEDLANNVSRFVSSKVSADRINEFLKVNETPKYQQLHSEQPRGPDSPFIGIEKGTLRWDKTGLDPSAFKLRNIDVSFKEGALNVVVGPTGSGKSSLLMALLGEMYLESGRIFLPVALNRHLTKVDRATGLSNTVAYCAQQAWLVNDSVRNNITFAAPFDQRRYDAVIEACQLTRDFEILTDGDKTLVGDKGITLSGGQKQRVSLARAMYSHSRYLILDDCLSAVDSHTAEALYRVALRGPISIGRTVILVSHNVALTVSQAEHVVVMNNGHVVAQGPPSELGKQGHLGTDDLVIKSAQQSEAPTRQATPAASSHPASSAESEPPTAQETNAQVSENALPEEERGVGNIQLSTYTHYAGALGSFPWWVLLIVVSVAAPVGDYLQQFWVKLWTSGGSITASRELGVTAFRVVKSFIVQETPHTARYWITGYMIVGLAASILGSLRDYVAYMGAVHASRELFHQLTESVIHARTRFFDSTPVGRVINRFSKDIETVDQELMPELMLLFHMLLNAIAVVVVLIYFVPYIVPFLLLIFWMYYIVGVSYVQCSRELKRMESTSRSPIFQEFGEILTGSATIRAFGETTRFLNANWTSVDRAHRPYFYLWLTNRWLAFWCSTISSSVFAGTAAVLIYNHNRVSAGAAGLVLSYANQLGTLVLWLTRMASQVAIDMNSVERIEEYVDVDQEAADVIPESRPPTSWPQKGEIEFKNLSLRYGDDLPMVIKNVSFAIESGMKVGIVGRTGAGKSTIITALFRLLEPAGGSVVIDGIDITTIGLGDLRSKLSIIPQDPTLFNGTVRSNVDPFNEHTDDAVFTSLSRVGLVPRGTTAATAREYTAVAGENANQFQDLSSEVAEGGANLSQGQRQLICLARAVLRSSKILLLDEATASIDYDTDTKLQQTIREEFSHVTILTIAHRLRTIADYDRILVLERGEVAQYGTPAELLKQKDGIFYSMSEKSGEMDALVALANKKA